MSNCKKLFSDSARELKSLKTLTVGAMLIALTIALSMFRIPVSDLLQIRFEFLAIALAGMLYGPVVGGIVAGAADILSLVFFPIGAYFPGMTLTAVLGGVIYGLFFYKKPVAPLRVLLAMITIALFCNVLLNSIWLWIMYGQGYIIGMLPMRILKNAISAPVNAVLFYAVSKPLSLAVQRLRKAA